jgi:hypothetical protein
MCAIVITLKDLCIFGLEIFTAWWLHCDMGLVLGTEDIRRSNGFAGIVY